MTVFVTDIFLAGVRFFFVPRFAGVSSAFALARAAVDARARALAPIKGMRW